MRVRRKEPCLLPSGYKAVLTRKAGVVIVTTLVGPVADYSVAGIDRSGGPALKRADFPRASRRCQIGATPGGAI
jgi:hypothetical protein